MVSKEERVQRKASTPHQHRENQRLSRISHSSSSTALTGSVSLHLQADVWCVCWCCCLFIFVPLLTTRATGLPWLRAQNERSTVFLEQKGGWVSAAAVAPQLWTWHRSWVETQICGESTAFPLGPNREHMSHAGFSHRLLDRTVRRAANLLSYFIMPGSVTHGNATLVKVDLQPCRAILLWFCDLSRTCSIKGSLNRDRKSFCFFFAWRGKKQPDAISITAQQHCTAHLLCHAANVQPDAFLTVGFVVF